MFPSYLNFSSRFHRFLIRDFLFHSGSDMEVDSKNGSGLTN